MPGLLCFDRYATVILRSQLKNLVANGKAMHKNKKTFRFSQGDTRAGG